MSIRAKIKSLLAGENITIKEAAEKLSAKNHKKINPDSISQKLLRGTIKFCEVEELLDILDYDIVFKKRSL